MPRTTLLASTLALLIAGTASLAQAQTPGASTAPAGMAGPHRLAPGGHGMHGWHGMRRDDEAGMGVIADLRGLERLYRAAGRTRDLVGVYNDVLAKSQDPRVRAYAYHHLARVQAEPTRFDDAIATMRKSLDESLANDAKERAERARMRARWSPQAAVTPGAEASK